MGKVIRTTTVTSTAKVPYHFICPFCGKRNDQLADLAGRASETRTSSYQRASGTLGVDAQKDMLDTVRKTDEELRTYADRIREVRNSGGEGAQAFREMNFSFLSPFVGAVCAYCGKKQRWTRSPEETEGEAKGKKSRIGCLVPLAGLVLSIVLFVVASRFSGTSAADILGAAGFLILIGGIIFFLVNFIRSSDKADPGFAPEKVDPDTIPVLDLQDITNPDRIPSEDRLDAPAKITIIRDPAFLGNGVTCDFTLNGKDVGELANDESLDTTAHRRHNVLYAYSKDYNGFPSMTGDPLAFEVEPGAEAEIHFRATKFLPEDCTGIRVIK